MSNYTGFARKLNRKGREGRKDKTFYVPLRSSRSLRLDSYHA